MDQYIPLDYPNYAFTGGAYESGENNNACYLLAFVLIIIAAYAVYKFATHYKDMTEKLEQVDNRQTALAEETASKQESHKRLLINVNHQMQPQNRPRVNPIREYDYRTLYDPLVAPRRRDDYDLPVLPYPTRGYPNPFHKMGLLIDRHADNNDRYKILLLMGRNTYPGSRTFEYYATENLPNSGIKFNIEKRNGRELYTDDSVKIRELNNKHYRVVLDQPLGYSYDPYI